MAAPTSTGAEELPLTTMDASNATQPTNYLPLPADDEQTVFIRPRPPFVSDPDGSQSPHDSSARESYAPDLTPVSSKAWLPSKQEGYSPPPSTQKSKRRLIIVIIALSILLALIVAVVVPVYFTVIKPKNNASQVSTGAGSTTGAPQPTSTSGPTSKITIFGGDGSTVTTNNGSTFTYNNKLGGIWYYDPDNPYSNNAYPNSWTPPLNQSWNFKTDRIYGVNLGGWFVLEPFITPALFQKYPTAIDEWTFSTSMAADGGLSQLEEHYKTFITEDDIAEIAGAGLNWIRLPIPYWSIDVWNNEPFLARTSWKYILQALQWCRKYGLRVKIDLHTVPGSQNGYNHGGVFGVTNFLRGTMGIANAQRMLNYIRIFTEFFSQPEWKDIVVIFGIMNEARMDLIGESQMWSFYYQTHKMMRNITGTGEGKGPYISIHDAFVPLTHWPAGFIPGGDRVIVDAHPYVAFDTPASTDPLDTGTGADAGGTWPAKPCGRWAADFNNTRATYGVTIAGEWANAVNDCGLFVRGVNQNPTFTGDCALYSDSTNWTPGMKAGVMRFALANMDAYRDWFFWTWKVNPSQRGVVEAPLWSYQLGLRNGWMPKDPRIAIGTCGASAGPVWNGDFASWMTGGAGAGQLSTDYPWPPATLSSVAGPATALPVYTPTGTVSTLPVPTYTNRAGKPVVSGNGWFNAQDNVPAPTPISGCTYPDPWHAEDAAVPAAGCLAGA